MDRKDAFGAASGAGVVAEIRRLATPALFAVVMVLLASGLDALRFTTSMWVVVGFIAANGAFYQYYCERWRLLAKQNVALSTEVEGRAADLLASITQDCKCGSQSCDAPLRDHHSDIVQFLRGIASSPPAPLVTQTEGKAE